MRRRPAHEPLNLAALCATLRMGPIAPPLASVTGKAAAPRHAVPERLHKANPQ